MADEDDTPNVARFALVADDDVSSRLTGWVGDGPITPPSGATGWEVVARPKRRAITLWRGQDAPRIILPFLFDRWRSGDSVEDKAAILDIFRGLGDHSDAAPPLLRVEGATVPRYAVQPGRLWFIESVDWGEAIRRDSDGELVRLGGTLTLAEHTADSKLEKLKRSTRPAYRFVNVRKGDTFSKIAKRELGSAKYGRRLAKLNDARSVDVVLKRDKVKLPAGDNLAEWKGNHAG